MCVTELSPPGFPLGPVCASVNLKTDGVASEDLARIFEDRDLIVITRLLVLIRLEVLGTESPAPPLPTINFHGEGGGDRSLIQFTRVARANPEAQLELETGSLVD